MPSKGNGMTRSHTVWCFDGNDGGCGEWKSVLSWTLAEAASEARKLGWLHTKENGWICPDCYAIDRAIRIIGRVM